MTQVIDFIGGEYRNRTGVHGFAIRYVTTPPTRLFDPICGTWCPATQSMGCLFMFLCVRKRQNDNLGRKYVDQTPYPIWAFYAGEMLRSVYVLTVHSRGQHGCHALFSQTAVVPCGKASQRSLRSFALLLLLCHASFARSKLGVGAEEDCCLRGLQIPSRW
jgi:hypothetical protein